MSNWWEAYPVADEAGLQAVLAPPEPKTAKPEQPQAAEGGKWWEAYPAVRADVGSQAVLAGIEDEKKRQEEQAMLHQAHQSIETYGETATVASQIVTDTASVVERAIGMGERADEVNRKSAILDQALSERDAARWRSEEDPAAIDAKLQDNVRREQEILSSKEYDATQKSELVSKLLAERQMLEDERMSTLDRAGQYVPFLKQGARGAGRSLGSAMLGSKVGGAYGAIGLASAQEANQAMTEGTDAGLKGSALASYAASQGVIEAAPAIVMQRLGLGGVEAMVAGPSIRGGIKAGILEAIKRTGQEIPEELVTEIGHAVAAEYSGLDPQALDPDRLSSMVADTTLQTILMGGGAGVIKTAQGAAQGRLDRLQAIRAKGFVSAEDAKKEGIEGKNRKERLANADAAIEQLTKEAAEGQTPPNGQQPPPLPASGQQPPPLPPKRKGPKDAGQVPANETLDDVQGNAGEGGQVDGSGQVRGPGQVEGGAQPPSQEPPAPQVPVGQPQRQDDLKQVGEAGSAIVDNMYQGIRDSLAKTGDVPKAERESRSTVAQAWDAAKANGLSPDEFVDRLQAASKEGRTPKPSDFAPAPEATTATPQPTEAAKPAWDVVKGQDGNLYREDPQAKSPSERIKTRQPVDPAEGVALVTKDQFGKPVPPETLKARQEFADKAKPGAAFEHKGYQGQSFKVLDDGTLLNSSGRRMGDVQAMANTVEPGQIAWKEGPAGSSEGVGTKPATGSPPVSPDAPAKPETSMGKAAGENQPSETRADAPLVPAGILEESSESSAAEIDRRMKDKQQPESKWQAETRAKLEVVPAFKGAKVEADEKAGTVKVTRSDGLATTVHFDADEKLAEAAKKFGRKQMYGLYFRKNGETEGRIYIHSKANHANILNHEVMHWLEDTGIVTKEEVEQHGGQEAIAEKYGKWASLKQRKKDSVFQRIYDTLEPVFSSQARFFEEVGKRSVEPQKKPQPSWSEQSQKNYIKQKRALTKAKGTEDPREILKAAEQGMASFEQFGEPDDWSSWVRAKEDAEQAIKREAPTGLSKPESGLSKPEPPAGYKPRAEFTPVVIETKSPDLELQDNRDAMKELKLKAGDAVGYRVYPKRGSTKGGYWQYGIVKHEPSGSHATIQLADGTTETVGGSWLHKLEPILDLSVSGQAKPIPGMEDEEATYTVHNRKPDVIPDTFSVVVAGKPRGKGWVTVKGTGLSAEEAYDRAVRMFTEKRAAEPTGEQDTGTERGQTGEQAGNAEFDAEMEKLMAGLAEPESGLTKPPAPEQQSQPARKPRSVKKPAKTAEEKSADDRARAAAKKEEAKRKMREAFEDTQGRPLSGFDPQIGLKVAQATKLYIEAGALDFRAFIRELVADFGKAWVEDKAPYFESAWRTANKLKWVDSPTGKVADVLAEEPKALYTVEGEEGMIARVFKHDSGGFSVSVTDTDSGLSGDQIRIFPELGQAKDYADTIKAPASSAADVPAQTRIANRVREALEKGEELTSQKFFAIADEEFGGTRANNDYGDSQATDALELGVNLYLQGKTDANVSPERAKATLEQIQQVMQLVPRHRGRTGNKDLMQQFSTPPAYAYAVSWIANITDEDVVLEPSAGMGGIAIHAANSGAKVYGNELDKSRAEGLRELPLEQVFTEDAEQIGAILKGKMPGLNVVIMNPPFSRAGMRMGDRMVQGTDRKHIDEALTLLPEGGRLVAIVGAGLHGQGQKMTQWLDKLPYQLAANIEVAREVYRGYGTEFPTRVLVIDKVPRTKIAVVGNAGSLSELIDLAERVRDDRPTRNVEPDAAQSDSAQGAPGDGQGARATDDARDPAPSGVPGAAGAGAGQTDDGQRESDRGGGVVDDNAATGGASQDAGGGRGGRGGRGQARKPSRSSKGTKAKPSGNAPAGKPQNGSRGATDRGGGLTKVKATSRPRAASVKTELGESTFEVYTPSVVVEGAKPHPAPIVESAAMAAVDAPRVDYEVDLMPGVLEGYVNDDGAYVGISDIQLEAIAMAGAAHEQKLPSGQRRGFLIGDGTGVGKAREALGIIMDDFLKRGTGKRRKAVFITKNDGLVKDAVNEWVGVGGDPAEMQPLSNVSSGAAVNYESGVLTLSYDSLKGEASVVAKAQGNTLSRVDQIVDWVGEDFDGVVVFDEAHLMANSMDTGTGTQAKGASMRALAGVDLQQRLPNARFVYLSATAATEVRNLAYAERLGLWGPGTAFDTKHRFVSEIEAGGVAAMEKVAADMKAMGMYVARNLSFDDGTPNGRVEFDRIMHTLSDDQRRVYDKLSEAWLKVLADIDAALDITNNEKGKSRILSAFWSSNQRFWNDVVTTMMAPTLIQNIEKDLAADRSVVIQLSTTKEAATGRAIAGMREGQTYDEIDASPRRALMEYVERAFPTQRHETYLDDAGNERTRPVFDSEGKPVHDPQAIAMKEQLLDEIGSLEVAARGPIDMILDHFGTDMVAEISGRSQRLVKGDDGRLELEKRGKASARADRDSFMDGKKRVLLFSEAGGTGASYHASLSVANQQRRSHYLWQPGWSAPVAVQGLGRAHRSNQASAPMLHLLEPNLEGYKRFISTIARRLGQLGALTKGQRTAADAGLFGANDNLESTEANSALFQFMRDAVNDNIDGIDRDFLIHRLGLVQLEGGTDPSPEMFTITQFLNRMLNLPLGEQNRVFGEFQSRLDNIVAQAIQDGTLDQGMETLKAEKIVKAKETIVNEHQTGAKTKLVELTLTHKLKPKSFEDMLREASGYTQFSLHGFVKSKTTGKVSAVIDQNRTSQDDKGRTLHDAMFISVAGNTYGHSLEQIENAQYWEQLPREQAKALWDQQFRESPTTHDSTEYLLTGALLPIWNKIPGERSRVLRALTVDGEMILGRVVPERMLQRTLDSLGISSEAGQRQYTPLEAIQAIYQGGTVQLANGWTIKKRTIDGEDNIEIMGPDYSSTDGITNAGGFTRRIDYKTRFFIPFDDTQGEVLGEITRISPIASITAAPRSGGGGVAKMANPTRQSRSDSTTPRVPGEGIAAADIQKTARRLFGVGIGHGGFSEKAAGIYKWLTRSSKSPPSPEMVRTAEGHYANLAVLAHEIAHHIDEKTKAVQSMPKAVKQEVAQLDYEPQKARAFEGWAEFLRRYMTEPPIDVAGNMIPNPGVDAPATLAWFEQTFLQAHPDVAKAIAEFREYAQQFANQSVFARIGSMIAERKPQDLEFKERWKRKGKRFVNRLKSYFLDKFHTLHWIQEEAKAKGYKDVGIYDLTMAYFLSASSHATIAFEEGVRSLMTGEPIGKTKLWAMSRHLENDGEYDEAIRYALARHTLFMDEVKPGYNTGVDVDDAQAWVEEAESLGKADRYEHFARELAQFNDDLIMMLVDVGALSNEDAGKILNYYRDAAGVPYYFPLHRISDLEDSEFSGTSAGFVNLGKPVKGRSRQGSGRQIIDPVDATITRAIKFYGRAIQARQAHTLAKTLDPKLGGVGGMGGLMDRVPAKRVVHQGTIEEILGTLVSSGTIEEDQARAMRIAARILDPDNGMASEKDLQWFADKHQIDDWENDWDAMEAAAEEEPDALAVISLWRPDYTPTAQKRTVMIYDPAGNKLMYQLDDDLYRVTTGMQEVQFNGFMNILRESARYFKTGSVGLSTGFGTANLLRDYWEFQGKANHVKGLKTLGKPWQMLGMYVAEKTKQSMVGKSVGKKLGITQKPNNALIRLYEETGGKVYSPVGHDAEGRSIYRRRKMGKSTMSRLGLSIQRPMDTADNVLTNLQELIAMSDAPPRLADAEAALAEHGFVAQGDKWLDTRSGQLVDHLPESARIAAAVAMAEATINFKRIGAAGQYVEAFFPFFNATIQATYRQYQQVKNLKSIGQDTPEGDRALRMLVYLAALASTGVIYWLLRHDDDDWRNQDAWLRDGYWTWGENGKTYLRIPKPRDFAVVSNVAENMLDAWAHEDARETSDIFKREAGGRIPTGGGMLRGAVETYIADYDYFRGRELEDESVEKLPKPYRTSSYTSRMSDALGKQFGKATNTSPIQFQHLLNSATGGMYGRLTDTYDAVLDGRVGPEHIPFVRGLLIDRRQTRPIGEFYEKKAELEELAATQKIEQENVSPEVADKLSHFDWISEVMTALRKDEAKLGKKRSFENEKYITGLARAALGYEEQESNPNPLTAQELPEDIRETIDNYRQLAVAGAAERLSPRSVYKSDEAYAERKAQVERAEAKFRALNLSLDEAKRSLLAHWEKTHGSVKDEKGDLKEAVRTRLRKLEELFKAE